MGRWARRWNRTVISFSVMATSAGMSMRSRKISQAARLRRRLSAKIAAARRIGWDCPLPASRERRRGHRRDH
jgi:hypothetical protein